MLFFIYGIAQFTRLFQVLQQGGHIHKRRWRKLLQTGLQNDAHQLFFRQRIKQRLARSGSMQRQTTAQRRTHPDHRFTL